MQRKFWAKQEELYLNEVETSEATKDSFKANRVFKAKNSRDPQPSCDKVTSKQIKYEGPESSK